MKKITFVLAAISLLSGFVAKSQTADEVINKYISAVGGKDVIAKIKSQKIYSDLTVMGATLNSTTTIVVGKGFRNEAIFNGQSIIQVVTPTGGWSTNPFQGATEPQPLSENEVKAGQSNFDIGGGLFDYKEKGSKAELVGTEKLDGVSVYKIKLTDKDSKENTFYFDATTYYLVKQESTANVNGMDVASSTVFSNYKKTDIGFTMPFTMLSNQGFELTMNITKVEFNTEIDPKIFEMPK
jgi:hypothetical protein